MFLLENSRTFFVCKFSRFVVNYLKRIAWARAGRVGKGGSRTAHNRVRVVLGFSRTRHFLSCPYRKLKGGGSQLVGLEIRESALQLR